jgi:hypothetical protein
MTKIPQYPEFRHARLQSHDISIAEHLPLADYQSADSGDLRVTTKRVPGIRLDMPLSDFERMITIYQTHYHCASANPAVQQAWQQYQMLIALTMKEINGQS